MELLLKLLASLVGFCVSFYIYTTIQSRKTLTCPIGHTCDSVVTSKYGSTFGIKNTLLGMLYYGIMLVSVAFVYFGYDAIFSYQNELVTVISGGAFLFSVYLIYIQAFVLKEWCSWCVLSAICSTSIFLSDLILIA